MMMPVPSSDPEEFILGFQRGYFGKVLAGKWLRSLSDFAVGYILGRKVKFGKAPMPPWVEITSGTA